MSAIASPLMVLTSTQADTIESTIARLRHLAKRLEDEATHLRAENASLWESVHERDETIAELRSMVQRAHEDLPR